MVYIWLRDFHWLHLNHHLLFLNLCLPDIVRRLRYLLWLQAALLRCLFLCLPVAIIRGSCSYWVEMIRFADKARRVTADSRLIVILILVASDQRLLQRLLLLRGYLSVLFRSVCIGISNESASRFSLYGALPRIRMLIFCCKMPKGTSCLVAIAADYSIVVPRLNYRGFLRSIS